MGNTDSKVSICIRVSGGLVETRARQNYIVRMIFQVREQLKTLTYKEMNFLSDKMSSPVWAVIINGMAKGHWNSMKIMHKNSNIVSQIFIKFF